MAQTDIERMIGEVARRHNLLLPRDDPTFVVLTLNELALEGLIARVEAAQDQIAAGVVQQRAAARELAERVLVGGADYVRRSHAAAADELRAALKETLAGELAAFRRAAAEAREARRSAWLAALAATGAVCLLIGAAAAALLR
jgi:hypothetical protein